MKEIIIHCSATPNGRETTAKDIHGWHLANGWDGIGYHYVILVDGSIEQGRPEYWKGAHAGSHNPDSIGICMIGTDEYSVSQWNALEYLVSDKIRQYPGIKVLGHNEISPKKCPGFDVQWWLKAKLIRV